VLPPRNGPPRELFETDRSWYNMGCSPRRCYDVSPDRQRFYAFQKVASPPPPAVTHVNILQNWFEELKAKVPATRQASLESGGQLNGPFGAVVLQGIGERA